LKVDKYNIPDYLLYTKEHEWARIESDGNVVVGITDYAADQLHDIVFVELPAVGSQQKQGSRACSVESVKSSADVTSPLSGKVTKVNNELSIHPEKVNQSPYGEGWFFELTPLDIESERKNLMDSKAYSEYLKALLG
jgi:glycine cleavage system H protein